MPLTPTCLRPGSSRVAAKGGRSTGSWQTRFFRRHRDDDPGEMMPGQEFLRRCPRGVAASLLAIVEAVASAPPPQFTGGGMWEAMHGTMAGFYEARKRGPDRRLYRLFCLLESEAPGLDGPTIVVICGGDKPHGTAFSEVEYQRFRVLGDEYRSRSPRNVR